MDFCFSLRPMKSRIAIFASGSGTNAEEIMTYFKNHPSAEVVLLLSNNPQAYALERAKKFNVSTGVFDKTQWRESEVALDWLKEKVGSYEGLFSKRALKYRGLGLHEMDLKETDYRKYMLEEYTFLKRPFIIYDENIWIGNAKKEVESAVAFFNQL